MNAPFDTVLGDEQRLDSLQSGGRTHAARRVM
jgi:hypothetical protein